MLFVSKFNMMYLEVNLTPNYPSRFDLSITIFLDASLTLSKSHSTSEYCAPVWCRSICTRLIDNVLKDALCIVTGCLRPTLTNYLPILAGIQPAELRRQRTALSFVTLAYRSLMNSKHLLHQLMVGSVTTLEETTISTPLCACSTQAAE